MLTRCPGCNKIIWFWQCSVFHSLDGGRQIRNWHAVCAIDDIAKLLTSAAIPGSTLYERVRAHSYKIGRAGRVTR